MIKTATRTANLKQTLAERGRELRNHLRERVRDGRTGLAPDGGDDFERSEADTQQDIEFALLQMRAATLARIDAALVRLEAGKYGFCFDCEVEVSEQRLRALPFAVRCQACEEQREQQARAMPPGQSRAGFPLFAASIDP
jgi:DnaK suppressor protein